MSRSPRKLVHRAADALSDVVALMDRYPEARADVAAAVGAAGVEELAAIRERIAAIAAALDASRPPA